MLNVQRVQGLCIHPSAANSRTAALIQKIRMRRLWQVAPNQEHHLRFERRSLIRRPMHSHLLLSVLHFIFSFKSLGIMFQSDTGSLWAKYCSDNTVMTIFLQMIIQSGDRTGIRVHIIHFYASNCPFSLSYGKDFVLVTSYLKTYVCVSMCVCVCVCVCVYTCLCIYIQHH